jgi:hypothetical protein
VEAVIQKRVIDNSSAKRSSLIQASSPSGASGAATPSHAPLTRSIQ